MHVKRFVVLALVLAGLAVIASVGAAPSRPFKVSSTLDGKGVLPHRIRWIATPTLPRDQIKALHFLIDGRLRWLPGDAYNYGGDVQGKHLGYLVTSWLSPGKHRFTVQAWSYDGRTATDTVVARVLPPPKVPAQLSGTWQRTISDTSGAPAANGPGNPTATLTPPGVYRITFDRRWIHDEFPCASSPCRFDANTGSGGEFDTDWRPRATTFEADGSVAIQVAHDSDRLGGAWCYWSGPPASYTWSVSGSTLTLAPVGGKDACGIRGFVWAGQWSRVG